MALEVRGYDFFIRKNISQLLFDGYDDFLTSIAHKINPQIPQQTKFGFMYPRNNTDDGIYNVFSGQTKHSMVNVVDMVNGCSQLSFWSNETCNDFSQSTNGELFPPIIGDGQRYVNFFR